MIIIVVIIAIIPCILQCARQLLNKTISSILEVQKEKGGDVDGIYEETGYEILSRVWLPNVAYKKRT